MSDIKILLGYRRNNCFDKLLNKIIKNYENKIIILHNLTIDIPNELLVKDIDLLTGDINNFDIFHIDQLDQYEIFSCKITQFSKINIKTLKLIFEYTDGTYTKISDQLQKIILENLPYLMLSKDNIAIKYLNKHSNIIHNFNKLKNVRIERY